MTTWIGGEHKPKEPGFYWGATWFIERPRIRLHLFSDGHWSSSEDTPFYWWSERLTLPNLPDELAEDIKAEIERYRAAYYEEEAKLMSGYYDEEE